MIIKKRKILDNVTLTMAQNYRAVGPAYIEKYRGQFTETTKPTPALHTEGYRSLSQLIADEITSLPVTNSMKTLQIGEQKRSIPTSAAKILYYLAKNAISNDSEANLMYALLFKAYALRYLTENSFDVAELLKEQIPDTYYRYALQIINGIDYVDNPLMRGGAIL